MAQVDGIRFSQLGPATALVESQLTPIYPASAFYPSSARVKQPGLGAVASTLPKGTGPGGSAAMSYTKEGAASAMPSPNDVAESHATHGSGQSVNVAGKDVPLILIYIVAFTLAAYLVLHYIHFGGSAQVSGG